MSGSRAASGPWIAPIPVDDLALAVDIREIRELDDDSFEGALVTNPGKTQGGNPLQGRGSGRAASVHRGP